MLWALVLATLAPGIAHALQHLRGDTVPWSVVCSASGIKRVVFDGSSSQGPQRQAHAFEHCAACALHLDAAAGPPAAADAVLRTDLALTVPSLWLHAPPAAHGWRSALPRAPPHTA